MSKKLLDAEGDIIVSGVHPGLPNKRVPLWARSSGILFEDGAVKPAPGQSPLFAKLHFHRGNGVIATTGLFAGQGESDPGLIWATQYEIYAGFEVPSCYIASRETPAYTGAPGDQWSFVQFGRIVLGTNGVDEVQYLAPDATYFVDLSTVSDMPSTFRCAILAKLGAYIIAFNTDNSSTEYRWCSEDDVTVWIPAATNSARDMQIRELNSAIVAVVPFASGLAIVGRNAIRVTAFVGPPFFFPNNHLLGNIGATSKGSVVESGRIIYGFGPDGIWATDGTGFEYIDQPSMHKYVYDETYDVDRSEEVVTWADADNNMIYFSYPSIDGLGKTVGWDFRQKLWSQFDFWRTAATTGETWQIPITLDDRGNIWGQGVRGQPSVGDPTPMAMRDGQIYVWGFGYMGYGQDVWGGYVEGGIFP